jgi:energy-coupling factor transporter ATP-binding protein EcfA2
MRIKTVRLKHFKRFDDLTITLGENPKKIIALVGPNGCGKSSIFDAFEQRQRQFKGSSRDPSPSFFSKLLYSIFPEKQSSTYNVNDSVQLIEATGADFDKKSFNIRSPYRFTSRLNVSTIKSLPDVLDDKNRPASSTDIDSRLQENYERLLGLAWNEFQYGDKSGKEIREKLAGKINAILNNVIEIKISQLGDVIAGKGQLYFEKGTSKDFPYENLSSGEKEVVDIVIDLVIKTPEFNNTIYCIDEPELHLNTAIQRKLLIEIEKLIPDTCQLWVATHSIGFLRALQEDLKEKCSIIDFSEKDYFNSACTIEPMPTSRKNWQRIFQTALEDLTGLLAPKKIIYCEGRPEPDINNGEQGLDADIYNEIFSEEHHDILFVSSGGGGAVTKSASLALKVLNKAFIDVKLYLLKDRDEKTESERENFLNSDTSHRMLKRREIENYLFDKEILQIFCSQKSTKFDENKYNSKVIDINQQDLKPIQQDIQACCGISGNITDFKRDLAKAVLNSTQIFTLLNNEIF